MISSVLLVFLNLFFVSKHRLILQEAISAQYGENRAKDLVFLLKVSFLVNHFEKQKILAYK